MVLLSMHDFAMSGYIIRLQCVIGFLCLDDNVVPCQVVLPALQAEVW